MVGDLVAAGCSTVLACELVGQSRATYYRHQRPKVLVKDPIPQSERAQPAALSTQERQRILQVLNTPEYAGLSVCQVFYRHWDTGQYLASKASWYRVARAAGQVGDRRRQATGSPKKIPELVATGPDQVWCWDITKLRTPVRGRWFHLYVITDIFSRKVTGYRIERFEDQYLAQEMIHDAVTENGKVPKYLHSDNGGAMVSQPVAELLKKLGVAKSFSRPHVSNDNPYIEALFKTCKYDINFPEVFNTIEEAQAWCQWFFHEYNHNHRHSGIGWHTPADVHHRRTSTISATRRKAIEKNWRDNRCRYDNRPKPPTIPDRAGINDPHSKKTTTKKTTNLSHSG